MRRTKKILVLVHPDDIAAFKAAARFRGQPMAAFVRHVARTEADKIIRENNLPLPPVQGKKDAACRSEYPLPE
jgi:hypothetical protein